LPRSVIVRDHIDVFIRQGELWRRMDEECPDQVLRHGTPPWDVGSHHAHHAG